MAMPAGSVAEASLGRAARASHGIYISAGIDESKVTIVRANAIDIEYEAIGPRDGQPIVLIMGLGMQLTAWPDEFCQGLAGHGFRVIRFDNRDTGLSTKMPSI